MAEEEDVMRPSDVDSLPSTPGEPEGWHVREKTEDGYPLTGSSSAEREKAMWRTLDSRAQGMRDHMFEGEGRYCEFWRVLVDRMTGAGRLMMRDQCGYPHDAHPIPDPEPEAHHVCRPARPHGWSPCQGCGKRVYRQ